MSKKSRDFYHIQDQLTLAWRYASGSKGVRNPQIEALSREIDDLGRKLIVSNPELSEYIELSAKKIALLEKIAEVVNKSNEHTENLSDKEKRAVEVSLSSSGMGFFSESFAEDDAKIEISLNLTTLQLNVEFRATVLECRLSADSENPGYWIRVRFARDQGQQIDQLLAHVAQRQIEQLQRNVDAAQASNQGGAA